MTYKEDLLFNTGNTAYIGKIQLEIAADGRKA